MKQVGIIVGVQIDGVSDEEHRSSMTELGRLAKTLGVEVAAEISQRRPALSPAAVVGTGKLKEIAKLTGGTGVVPMGPPGKKKALEEDDDAEPPEALDGDESEPVEPPARKPTLILVDHDITPSQARNLARATGAEVLDRTAVILAIFQRHARSREARIQVEIARLSYMAPRLREAGGGGGDRQRGGIGGRGAGESSGELDKRKIRDRIAELRHELRAIEETAGVRRSRRAEQHKVALVGYTNAGKSSLMRALTGSEIYVADELFATLDTTVRALVPETRPKVLVSDTVGFIKKLPHDLVASFRSTLDEAREADLLLHVVDAADPAFVPQIQVTREVLGEIGAGETQVLLLLNKIDRVSETRRAELAAEYPDAVELSALRPNDVDALRARIVAFFESGMTEEELSIPLNAARLVGEVHASCRVLSENWDESHVALRVKAPPEVIARIRAKIPAAHSLGAPG